MFYLILVLYLLYILIFILHPNYGFTYPPPLSPSYFSPFSPPTPSSFLFRKGQITHGYQQNMANQVAVRLRISSCIKARQGNPMREVGSQMPVKKSETDLLCLFVCLFVFTKFDSRPCALCMLGKGFCHQIIPKIVFNI